MFTQSDNGIFTARIRRMGKVMSSVCPHLGGGGGYPYPIMLCNITQNAMGQTPGRGVPISHNSLQHYPEFHEADTQGGTLPGLAGGYPAGGYPARDGGTLLGVPCWGVPCRGVPCWGLPCLGVPCWGGTLLVGGTQVGYPPSQVRTGGYPAGGYPVRTTEGVLTAPRAVCLWRSRRRTFLLQFALVTDPLFVVRAGVILK